MPIFPAEEPFNPYAWFYSGITEEPKPGPLSARAAHAFVQHPDRTSSGRRMRCFGALIALRGVVQEQAYVYSLLRVALPIEPLVITASHPATYGEVLAGFMEREDAVRALSVIPLRRGAHPDELITAIPQDYVPNITSVQVDPALHVALHDLSLSIIADIREAAEALNNPDVWYPGVDEGIEPVPDEHVDLVIWALQRELDRELRSARSQIPSSSPPPRRPALPLAELPRRVQRALVERRRLRYQQWGIGRKEWESGYWSLFNVPEDPDWLPPGG